MEDNSNTPSKIVKISHTLDSQVHKQLEEFAFRQRVSESSVIEFAVRRLFGYEDDEKLGEYLRASGAGRRRKT